MRYNKLFSVESWITQFFGHSEFARDHYKSGYHEGIDLVPIDRSAWELYTPTDGRVMWSGWGDTYGNNVIIYDEIRGMSFRYCHLKSSEVLEGDLLRVGERFAVAGNSGKSLGPHLHMNILLMTSYGIKDFPDNGYNGRENPLAALRALKVHI